MVEYRELADRIVSVFFPQRCLSCGDVVAYDDFWCDKCTENGKPPFLKHGKITCDFSHSFSDALAAFQYGDGARDMILRLKKRPDKRALSFLSREICGIMSEQWRDVTIDAIVPVPSSKPKIKERGFNPAESLALKIGGCIGLHVYGDALTRFDTQSQHGLTAAERQANAAKSYDVGNAGRLAAKTVLLVDDVFTTGATAEACARKLLEAGAKSVYVATSAYTKYGEARPCNRGETVV